MDDFIEKFYGMPFRYLVTPNLEMTRPKWFRLPSSRTVFILFFISYYFICGGIVYNIVIEPPAMGSIVDNNGAVRPVAFMRHRINGQYIFEGLTASLFFVLGSVGFILLERSRPFELFTENKDEKLQELSSFSLYSSSEPSVFTTTLAFMLIMISFAVCWIFMLTKFP